MKRYIRWEEWEDSDILCIMVVVTLYIVSHIYTIIMPQEEQEQWSGYFIPILIPLCGGLFAYTYVYAKNVLNRHRQYKFQYAMDMVIFATSVLAFLGAVCMAGISSYAGNIMVLICCGVNALAFLISAIVIIIGAIKKCVLGTMRIPTIVISLLVYFLPFIINHYLTI